MDHITSADGTEIAYEHSGDGPPLVLVHGCGVSSVIWEPSLDRLTDHFTVYRFDRRGRGESGDSDQYSLQREAEDLLAVIDTIEEPVSVFGHSFGANVAYEGAKRSDHVENLVLYEPRVPTPPHDTKPEFAPELWTYVENGDERKAKREFFKEMVDMIPFNTNDFPDTVTQTPALTLAREIDAAEGTRLNPVPDISATVLLLDAEESPAYFRDATATISSYLPESKQRLLPGIGHETITEDTVIEPVIEFLTETTLREQTEPVRTNNPA